MRNRLFVVAALSSVVLPITVSTAHAQATAPQPIPAPSGDPDKAKAIQRLLELTGTVNLGNQMMRQMLTQMRQTSPNIPAEFFNRFEKKANMKQFLGYVTSAYDKRFTKDEINGLIAFYETPLGAKLIQTQPAINQELTQAGMQWGQKVAGEVIAEMQAELSKKPKAAAKPK